MRWTQLLTTWQPDCANATDLLAAAGYTHRLADGLYSLLPLGQRVLERVNRVIRGELVRVGAQELTLPLLQPQQLWDQPDAEGETRADAFGSQLLRVVAAESEALVLAPTHEQVAAVVASACTASETPPPRIAFQIQPRFRHQACRAEDGLLHTREFVMADAYSFHPDRASLDATYDAVKDAFARIASSCGLSARFVAADSGAIGGDESEELVAELPNAASEAAVVCCACGYAASIERAEFARPRPAASVLGRAEEVDGGAAPEARRLAWVPFIARNQIVLGVFPRGQLLSPSKLLRALSLAAIATPDLHPASARELNELGANYDTISLVRTPSSVLIVADEALRSDSNFCIPSARPGHFLINVNAPRDFRVDQFADICAARGGAACSRCGHELSALRGVEIGHIFKLGTRYTSERHASPNAPAAEMGCYGLGVTRLMASIAEQRRDARGIVWPEAIAPFLAAIVPAGPGVSPAALTLYHELALSGIDVLLDDSRRETADKLGCAESLGIPFQIVVPPENINASVALRSRCSSEVLQLSAADTRARLTDRRSRS